MSPEKRTREIKLHIAALEKLVPRVDLSALRAELIGRVLMKYDLKPLGRVSDQSNLSSQTLLLDNPDGDAFYPGQRVEAYATGGARIGTATVVSYENDRLVTACPWNVQIPAICAGDELYEGL